MSNIYPYLFKPVLKDYIWGGRNLETVFGRKLPSDINIAESWEIAAHKDGQSIVKNGALAGKTLAEAHAILGLDLIGTCNQWAQERGKFPLLIKLLDANRELSVQVHPDDTYALANEGNELGKSEMWYILDAAPDAAVIYGVTEGTTPENFAQAITDGNLEPRLHYLPVKRGDFVDVPAGTLHAILGGILVAEIQQNSNTTYRVYDWNRMGKDGKPRALHIDKSLDVINFEQVALPPCEGQIVSSADGITRTELCTNRYFTVEEVTFEAGATFSGTCDGSTFEVWGTVDGSATLTAGDNQLDLNRITFSLLPAALGEFEVKANNATTMLRAYVSFENSGSTLP
ncbi:MAG: type I phosphomannose isomerase catalytic subunit [Candidatus Promineifilaceae bacterium]